MKADGLLYKFIDDVTLTEIIEKGYKSSINIDVSTVVEWSDVNNLNLNEKKSKTMSLGPQNHDPLYIGNTKIEEVKSFKLLGVNLDNDLKFDTHVNLICAKASSRLYFIKHLKRSCLGIDDLVHYYQTTIRPVVEYSCPAWHSSLTHSQSHKIEMIQKRAFSIILGFSLYDNYSEFCRLNGFETLAERRLNLCKNFFEKSIINPNCCISHLLPKKNEHQTVTKLRNPSKYVVPRARTSRYEKSFIPFAANKFL